MWCALNRYVDPAIAERLIPSRRRGFRSNDILTVVGGQGLIEFVEMFSLFMKLYTCLEMTYNQ